MKISYLPRAFSPIQTSPFVVTKFLLALFLACVSGATGAVVAQTKMTATTTAQPPATGDDRQDAAPSRSTVRGRVVYEDTGRPLRRARVTLSDPAGDSRQRYRMTWTDARGEFILKNVAAGKYYVTIEAPGIVTNAYSNFEEAQRELQAVAVDGKSSAEMKIQVRRGGAVSGKVRYADGDPVVSAIVSVLRKTDGKLSPVYRSGVGGEGARTDDRGFYRIAGLPPGEYIVGVAEQMMRVTEREDAEGGISLDQATLAITYYSGATSTRSATTLKINAGEETEDIDITLVERSTHQLSGTVTARGDGRPVARARVSLVSKDRDEALSNIYAWGERSASTDAEGRWTFDEVTDGGYTITVTPESIEEYNSMRGRAAPGRAPQRFVSKRQDVTLAGVDVTGLTIEVSGGGRISGKVVVEGGKPLPPNIIVYPETAGAEKKMVMTEPRTVAPDGSFTLDGIPAGGFYLWASAHPESKFYTKSVIADGIDILRGAPLEIEEDAEIKSVRIVIASDVATLTGRVIAEQNGVPLRGASLMLMPVESERQQMRGARLYGFTNAEGQFTIKGAPGEYLIVVARAGDNVYRLGDELLRARTANAPRVALQPNERKSMDVVAPSGK